MQQVLIINGNPNPKSFCNSIADEYELSVKKNKNFSVQRINLIDLNFDLILRGGYQYEQVLEPDLVKSQDLIKAANHIVFIYPNWWGTGPALLKGFIDRVFKPGFAFKYTNKPFPEKLLIGKTSELIITLDTPVWFYKLFIRELGVKVMTQSILKFCGIKNKQITYLSPIKGTSVDQRRSLLEKVKLIGEKLTC